MLSGNDVEVDDGDYHQRTALHLAASKGHVAMVRHLVLIHWANMNVLDRSDTGFTCPHGFGILSQHCHMTQCSVTLCYVLCRPSVY